MTVRALNAVDAQAIADRHEDALAAAYYKVFKAAGRKAASRFKTMAPITAAAGDDPKQPNWTAPNIDELVDLALIAEQTAKATASIHMRTLAEILDAYGTSIKKLQVPVIGEPSFDVTNPAALTLLEGTGGRSGDVAKSVRDDLQKIIGDAYSRGLSVLDTAALIQEQTDQFSRAQSTMLARTDLNGIANGGSVIAATEVGVTYKTWLTASDDLVRPTHQDADGQTVPLDQQFDVGGEYADYPGDPSLSDAEACNCRCTVIYSDDLPAETAAVGPDVSSLAMIAVYPDADQAERIAPDGQDPSKFHVTLVFLGEADSFDQDAVREALASVASLSPRLSGQVGGIGRFAAGPDGAPMIALPDVRGLSALREFVATALTARGIESPSDHGWLPHMTLGYSDTGEMPGDDCIGEALTFSSLSLAIADARQDFPLGDDLQAAAVDATIGEDMKPAQITIPLTFSIGPAIADTATSNVTNGIRESFVRVRPDPNPFTTNPAETPDAEVLVAAAGITWRAVLCVEGKPTEDGRLLAPGSISWRDLPLTLLCQTETAPGHDGAEVCGRIDRIWRGGMNIMGEGEFDNGTFGSEAARLVGEETLRGVSVDLAVLEYEIRSVPDSDDAMDDTEAYIESFLDDPDELFVVTDGVIGAATICPFQAIADATIEVLGTDNGPLELRVTRTFDQQGALTAAAAGLAPLKPPADWLADPALDGPTPITVTDDGRVYGHAALWNTCHVGVAGACTTAPRSRSGYRYFHLGTVQTDEDSDLPVGQVTLGTGHASLRLGSDDALSHYDNTGTAAADVTVGEDKYGIWVAGALRPELSAERVRELRGSKLSGDWRNINGHLELVGLLAVNVPGFPVPHPSARVASIEPEPLALLAAGMLPDDDPLDPAVFQARARVLAARARGGVRALAELARS